MIQFSNVKKHILIHFITHFHIFPAFSCRKLIKTFNIILFHFKYFSCFILLAWHSIKKVSFCLRKMKPFVSSNFDRYILSTLFYSSHRTCKFSWIFLLFYYFLNEWRQKKCYNIKFFLRKGWQGWREQH